MLTVSKMRKKNDNHMLSVPTVFKNTTYIYLLRGWNQNLTLSLDLSFNFLRKYRDQKNKSDSGYYGSESVCDWVGTH